MTMMGRIFQITVFLCFFISSILCLDPPTFLDYSEIDGRFLRESTKEDASSSQSSNMIEDKNDTRSTEPNEICQGSVIGTVYAEDPDGTAVSFYLIGEGVEFFQIDRSTGVVTLKKLIDYDVRADKEISMTLKLVDEQGEEKSVTAKVFLEDVNDEVPTFVNEPQFKQISEDQEPGLEVATIDVADVDTKVEYADKRLSLVCVRETENQRDACEKFGLEAENRDVSNLFWRGKVILREKLDYEQRISYIIKLLANDGLQNSTQEVHVEVVDINDTPPRWVISSDKTIDEELRIGTVINTVSAVDQDTESPHQIVYDLIGDNSDIFSINETTGDIFPSTRIDFDDDSVPGELLYELTVRATEVISQDPLQLGNDSTTTATTVVTITVEDIDDNAPTFDMNIYRVSIKENIETRANIPGLQMTITDRDSGIFNSFDLLVQNHADLFGIIPSSDAKSSSATLFIRNSEDIDFEDGQKEYEVIVVARENQVPIPLSGTATVIIRVEDVNDEVPTFEQDVYRILVKEDRDVNSQVTQVVATDRELGDFGTGGIRYTLFGNQLGHFDIDPLTGVITTGPCRNGNKHGEDPCINYEKRTSYSLTVSATDNRGDGQTRPVQVSIIIEDVNDNRPQIEDSYKAYIYEGNMVTESPLIIVAQDPDTVGVPLIYSPIGDLGPFQILNQGPVSARYCNITARRPVLYSDAQDPTTGEVNFKVSVTDSLSSSIADVTIVIIDINNNEPVFFPPEYEEWIPENTTGRVFITTIAASDADAPTLGNGQLEFDIVTGAQGKFAVNDAVTYRDGTWYAEVYTLEDATFNYEAQNLYEMTLVARDLGTPASKSGSGRLIVHITDINNNAPQLDPPSFSLTVSENERVTTIVYTVRAIDPDEDSVLRYYFEPTRAQTPVGQVVNQSVYDYTVLFALDEETGDLSVNSQLNRDLTSFIQYNLYVVDINGAFPQTGTGALFITILEYNDQSPQFDFNPYNITMFEERYPNFLVRNLRCSDADDNIAGYSITQIDPPFPEFFALIDNTGSMIVRSRVDYEEVQKIELEGFCEDSGNPRRSNTTRIIVTVINLNDNSPQFDAPLYQASLPEQTESGAFVVTVSASDSDLEDYGVVRYRLADPADPTFIIDPIKGSIVVGNDTTFDREERSSFSFQVVAYDSPNDPSVRRQTQVPVYISVDDINDNCPKFRDNFYEGSIPESAPPGTFIIDIAATDDDIGLNGAISFSIARGSGSASAEDLFDVSSRSGRILTKDSLRNQAGTHFFNISAKDMNGEYPVPPACETQVPVQIVITLSENNPPIWQRPPQRDFVIEVLESQYEGMLVYNSRAIDNDQGNLGVVDYFFVVGDQYVSSTPEFRINQITGVIRAEIEYDREHVDTYFLTLIAKDRGVPGASSRTTLTVVILDVDDNDPRFPVQDGVVVPLVISLDEDIPVGQNGEYLDSCNATDLDSDHRNNRIFYELYAPDDTISELIHLGRETCDIILMKSPDFELTPTLRFNIFAFNERSDDTVRRYRREVNPSILPVVINVGNANDNPPTFSQSQYMACAYDDTPFLQNILFIEVTDLDGGSAPQLTLEGTNSFTIDSTGNIQNTQSLYSISGTVQTFQVKASDSQNNQATADVTIFVVGTNNQVRIKENRPRLDAFTDQAAALITASIPSIDFTCAKAEDYITSDGVASDFSSELVVAAVRIDSSSQPTSYHIYSAGELHDILEADGTRVEVQEESDDDFELSEDVVIIIFVICLVLLIIALLLFCLACYCIRDKKKKKTKTIKAQRHTIVQASNEQGDDFQNPVYFNQGYKPDEPEYAAVKKTKPIVPVVIAAPQNLEPLDSDRPSYLVPEPQPQSALEPEPVIVTEVLPTEPPQSPPKDPEPEFEDRIETIIVDDLPDPVSNPPVEENVIEVEFGDEPPELPHPADDFIDVEIVDELPLPSPPPAENEFRIETSVEES